MSARRRFPLYDAEQLSAEVRGFEERYGISTAEFFARHASGPLAQLGVSRHDANRWRALQQDLAWCRINAQRKRALALLKEFERNAVTAKVAADA